MEKKNEGAAEEGKKKDGKPDERVDATNCTIHFTIEPYDDVCTFCTLYDE